MALFRGTMCTSLEHEIDDASPRTTHSSNRRIHLSESPIFESFAGEAQTDKVEVQTESFGVSPQKTGCGWLEGTSTVSLSTFDLIGNKEPSRMLCSYRGAGWRNAPMNSWNGSPSSCGLERSWRLLATFRMLFARNS